MMFICSKLANWIAWMVVDYDYSLLIWNETRNFVSRALTFSFFLIHDLALKTDADDIIYLFENIHYADAIWRELSRTEGVSYKV